MRNVFHLADRLHKTPAEIRRDFTYEEFVHFMAHVEMLAEEDSR